MNFQSLKPTLLLVPVLFLIGCAGKPTRLVESDWVSMTKTNIPNQSDLSEAGAVEGQYCYHTFGTGHVGLMDEAILQAQKKYQVDYIRNAVFMMNRQTACVSVEGVGYRVKKI